MSELTREEFILNLERTDDVLEPGAFSEWARALLSHDAALRAHLAACEKERDEFRRYSNEDQTKIAGLETQLAAAQAEVARLEKHVYDTLYPPIPYVEIPCKSPAYYRVQEAARIIEYLDDKVKHLESRTARYLKCLDIISKKGCLEPYGVLCEKLLDKTHWCEPCLAQRALAEDT